MCPDEFNSSQYFQRINYFYVLYMYSELQTNAGMCGEDLPNRDVMCFKN